MKVSLVENRYTAGAPSGMVIDITESCPLVFHYLRSAFLYQSSSYIWNGEGEYCLVVVVVYLGCFITSFCVLWSRFVRSKDWLCSNARWQMICDRAYKTFVSVPFIGWTSLCD